MTPGRYLEEEDEGVTESARKLALAALSAPPAAEPPAASKLPKDTALDEALRAERENALGSGLARAGAMASAALTRRKFDPSVWDASDRDVSSPVKDFMLRRSGEAERVKAEKLAALADPNSPASIRMRALVGATGADIPQGVLGQITAQEGDEAFKTAGMLLDAKAKRDALDASGTKRQQEEERRKTDRAWQEEQRRLDRASREKQAALNRTSGERRAAILAGDKAEKDRLAGVQKFGEEVVKSGAPGFYDRYDEASSILKKYPKGEVPGYGSVQGRVPDWGLDAIPGMSAAQAEDARALRQAIGQLLSEFRKGQSGAGMSDSERAEYGKITGLVDTGTEAALRQGLERLKRAQDAKTKAQAAAYDPAVVEIYGNRVSPTLRRAMGLHPASPTTNQQSDTGAGQPSSLPGLDPNKQEVSRTYSKDGKWMRITYSDGTFGMAPSDRR